jgi:hypothetical protein
MTSGREALLKYIVRPAVAQERGDLLTPPSVNGLATRVGAAFGRRAPLLRPHQRPNGTRLTMKGTFGGSFPKRRGICPSETHRSDPTFTTDAG